MKQPIGGNSVKADFSSPYAPSAANASDLQNLKEHAEDSIELLMQIETDMNPFSEKPVLNEIIADIRKSSSLEELRRVINECLEAVKNVVATYIELNRVIEEVQGELIWKKLSEKKP